MLIDANNVFMVLLRVSSVSSVIAWSSVYWFHPLPLYYQPFIAQQMRIVYVECDNNVSMPHQLVMSRG